MTVTKFYLFSPPPPFFLFTFFLGEGRVCFLLLFSTVSPCLFSITMLYLCFSCIFLGDVRWRYPNRARGFVGELLNCIDICRNLILLFFLLFFILETACTNLIQISFRLKQKITKGKGINSIGRERRERERENDSGWHRGGRITAWNQHHTRFTPHLLIS